MRPEPPFWGCGPQRHVRRLRGDLRDAGLAALLEQGGVDGGDGERRVLQLGFAELRGHDDVGACALVGGGRRRRGGGSWGILGKSGGRNRSGERKKSD